MTSQTLTPQQRANKRQNEVRRNLPRIPTTIISEPENQLLDELSAVYGSKKAALIAGLKALKSAEGYRMDEMKVFSEIPDINGLYWYIVPGKDPEPVLIDIARYGAGKFAGFNGRRQSWLREHERLIGPQSAPVMKQQ